MRIGLREGRPLCAEVKWTDGGHGEVDDSTLRMFIVALSSLTTLPCTFPIENYLSQSAHVGCQLCFRLVGTDADGRQLDLICPS